MTAYWFKPKQHGYGSVPVTWQGWAVTFIFAAFVTVMVLAVEFRRLSSLWCVVAVLGVTAGFIMLGKAKTNGEWRWR